MRARVAAATTALVVLGALTGCTAAPSSAPADGTATTGTTSHADPAASTPSPMLTPTAPASTPLGAGERVWAAFSDRGLPYRAWWTQLRPQLSDAARAVYVYDDPRNIPSMKITDKVHLTAKAPAEPRFTAGVIVPTDKGVFVLDLERHTLRSPWLLYAIKFPPTVQ